jgi:hypothetical protein
MYVNPGSAGMVAFPVDEPTSCALDEIVSAVFAPRMTAMLTDALPLAPVGVRAERTSAPAVTECCTCPVVAVIAETIKLEFTRTRRRYVTAGRVIVGHTVIPDGPTVTVAAFVVVVTDETAVRASTYSVDACAFHAPYRRT